MKAIVLHCKPGSRFHLGLYAPDRDTDTALANTGEIIHSDTLFAALVNNWYDSMGNADEMVALFASGQCHLSSGFHCLQYGDRFVWFLPKPASFQLFDPVGNTDRKQFKKIGFLSAGLWQQLVDPAQLIEGLDIVVIDKRFALLSEELPPLAKLPAHERIDLASRLKICQTVTLPKVEVRNKLSDSRIYQLSVTEIADNRRYLPDLQVHYYFLLHTDDSLSTEVQQKLQLAVGLLQYNGIGAERSTIGCFENITEVADWGINVPQQHPGLACTLGLFSPLDAAAIYLGKPLLRGGRRLGAQNRQWLKSLRMLQEGAIVQTGAKGQLADVTPNESASGPYLRHGMALTLPIHQNWIPV
jgi:CRISPR type III-A-associated RAMP protein Csm4